MLWIEAKVAKMLMQRERGYYKIKNSVIFTRRESS